MGRQMSLAMRAGILKVKTSKENNYRLDGPHCITQARSLAVY
jgi:hypothetical protein